MDVESGRQKLMVVDDDEGIRRLIAVGLGRSGYDCTALGDGLHAVHALQADRYSAVIADVNMPFMRGTELLKWAKIADPDLPFVMISGAEEMEVVKTALRDGAFDFLVKPLDLDVLVATVRRAIEKGLRARELRTEQRQLHVLVEQRTRELGQALKEIEETYDATILALGSALETRDTETQTHCLRVAGYSLLLTRVLGITDSKRLTDIQRGAYLHDIGKIGVPDHILRKNGPLDEQERLVIRRHPEIGMRLLERIGFLKGATPIVWCHHERADGTGYPRGLQGEEIPLEARIFSVADTLDAMVSDRPYRPAMPLESARRLIDDGSRRQFDPVVTQALARIPDGDIKAVSQQTEERGKPSFFRTQ